MEYAGNLPALNKTLFDNSENLSAWRKANQALSFWMFFVHILKFVSMLNPAHKLFKTLFITFFLALMSACQTTPSSVSSAQVERVHNECVVLVHGLWRSAWAMRSIANDLDEYGYQTVSVSYPSTEMSIPEIAERFIPPAVDQCAQSGAHKIHIVSHSMGGVVARQYLQTNQLPDGSKVVMLSPPNQGSELSERFGDDAWYHYFVGPAGVSLSKKEGGIIPSLKAIDESVGIIAAYRSWSVWPSEWLPKPNDGTVSVESMKLPEMDDFILINSGHATMRFSSEIQAQIRSFIQTGRFDHSI